MRARRARVRLVAEVGVDVHVARRQHDRRGRRVVQHPVRVARLRVARSASSRCSPRPRSRPAAGRRRCSCRPAPSSCVAGALSPVATVDAVVVGSSVSSFTVTPPSPDSPGSCTPSPFASIHTRSPIAPVAPVAGSCCPSAAPSCSRSPPSGTPHPPSDTTVVVVGRRRSVSRRRSGSAPSAASPSPCSRCRARRHDPLNM